MIFNATNFDRLSIAGEQLVKTDNNFHQRHIEKVTLRMSRNSRGYDIVDTHVHIFDLDLRDHGMPNRNFTHGWPNDEDVPQINR